MSTEPPRDYAPSAVQATGHVAENVINGFKGQPALLAVVVLNCLAIGAGVWFMTHALEGAQKNMASLIASCFDGKENRQ